MRNLRQPTDLPLVSVPNTATTTAAIAAMTLIAMKIDVEPMVVSIQPTIIGISTPIATNIGRHVNLGMIHAHSSMVTGAALLASREMMAQRRPRVFAGANSLTSRIR
mgnify:CR=1 FL=1